MLLDWTKFNFDQKSTYHKYKLSLMVQTFIGDFSILKCNFGVHKYHND